MDSNLNIIADVVTSDV